MSCFELNELIVFIMLRHVLFADKRLMTLLGINEHHAVLYRIILNGTTDRLHRINRNGKGECYYCVYFKINKTITFVIVYNNKQKKTVLQ